MRYSLLAGGKRIRPVLTLAVAEREGRPPDRCCRSPRRWSSSTPTRSSTTTCRLSTTTRLRRGKPTCHVAYGEDVAILAGDGLFAEAFRLDPRSTDGEPAAESSSALAEVAAATGVHGMVGGQYMDVEGTASSDDELRLLHALKTGRLIEAAVAGAAPSSPASATIPP